MSHRSPNPDDSSSSKRKSASDSDDEDLLRSPSPTTVPPPPKKKIPFHHRFSAGTTQKLITCQLCVKPFYFHNSADCAIFTHPLAKAIIVNLKNLCELCFGNTHTTENCNKNYSCSICQERHNTKICTKELF